MIFVNIFWDMECINENPFNINGENRFGLWVFWFVSKIPEQIKLANRGMTVLTFEVLMLCGWSGYHGENVEVQGMALQCD